MSDYAELLTHVVACQDIKCEDCRRVVDGAREEIARLQRELNVYVSAVKEFVEADANCTITHDWLKAANDRADTLYTQCQRTPTEELQQRRRENLDECLRLMDVHSSERRRKAAARATLRAILADTALGRQREEGQS